MSTDSPKKTVHPVLARVKDEFGRFFANPIGYAAGKLVSTCILVLALWILFHAAKILITALQDMFAGL